MGPVIDEGFARFVLRPYSTSRTCQNLRRAGQAVFHVVDDVELLARAAVDRIEHAPALLACQALDGCVLADACRWYALRVRDWQPDGERNLVTCDVVASERLRDFVGLNRAKHAVVEAAILATRLGRIDAGEVRDQLQRLAVLVHKTGGEQEQRAWKFLEEYIHDARTKQ